MLDNVNFLTEVSWHPNLCHDEYQKYSIHVGGCLLCVRTPVCICRQYTQVSLFGLYLEKGCKNTQVPLIGLYLDEASD